MTAQNLTYTDFVVEDTPLLVVDGIGNFRFELRGQTPTALSTFDSPPFASIAQQAQYHSRQFMNGLWAGNHSGISRVALVNTTYQPTSVSQPGWVDPPYTGAPQPTFSIPQPGGSTAGADTYALSFMPTVFSAPAKIWVLNQNPLTQLTLRVWNWL